MTAAADIRFERRGGVAIATLDRPRALNAMTLDMYRAFDLQLAAWERDASVALVLVRGAGSRGFCAGGDVRAIHEARRHPLGPGDYKTELFSEEYRFIRKVHRLGKPYLAFAHGITMGGGAGLSVNGAYRVATESTLFAMPEVFIASIPDVGATRFFDRCPGRLGLYLALTGARIGAADAMACGLYTHVVRDARLGALTAALAQVGWQAGDERRQLEAVLADFAEAPGAARLASLRPAIDRCFGELSVAAIVEALRRERTPWAGEALAAMERASPLSLKLVFRQLQLGRGVDLEDALRLEFRIIQHLLAGDDFYEGVRSVVIDKDRRPRWRFSSLAQVTEAEVERHFQSLGERELTLA